MATLEKALALAATSHEGQKDRAGQPYILHPMRVMMVQKQYETMIAAILHDVVEDTNVTLQSLSELGFSQNVIDAIDALTRREGEDYFDYVRRCKVNYIAYHVKLADLDDNSDLKRLSPNLKPEDYARWDKYQQAKYLLLYGE